MRGGGLTNFFLSKGKGAFKGTVAYLRGGGLNREYGSIILNTYACAS